MFLNFYHNRIIVLNYENYIAFSLRFVYLDFCKQSALIKENQKMKFIFTTILALLLCLSSQNFAQSNLKGAYVGNWSNGRGEPMFIIIGTIQYGKDKPLKYRDVTKVTDGSYFNLEITEPGKINYFTKFLSLSVDAEKKSEMKMTFYNSYQDMFDGNNSQGENNWYRDASSKESSGNIKVYLVAVGDNGKTGKKIGCDDSLIAVNREVLSTATPLKAALEELLAIPREYDERLGNFWGGNNLKLKSISLSKGVATIRITGEGPAVAGVCDVPRITSQIEETAKQFSTVKKVRIFVNNRSLDQAIR